MLQLLLGWSVCLAVACLDNPVEESAGNWHQFRGPAGAHAQAHHPPMEWSDTKNIEWKVPIAGLGWSSPSVHRGVVYLTTAVPKGQGLSLRAMALDGATGKTLWDVEVKSVEKAPSIHAKNSHASPTPIAGDDAVYVHFGTLGTAKLRPMAPRGFAL